MARLLGLFTPLETPFNRMEGEMIESEEMHALGLKGHYIPACSSLSLIVISSRALRASILISEYSTMPV